MREPEPRPRGEKGASLERGDCTRHIVNSLPAADISRMLSAFYIWVIPIFVSLNAY